VALRPFCVLADRSGSDETPATDALKTALPVS
jgi:hypothetical protein